jgi:hypothetical protein
MKVNWSGGAAQTNCVLCAALLTRVILSSNSVPDPDSAVRSSEKADVRSVLIGPGPGRTFPDTFRLAAVTPAFRTGGSWKVTILSSKVKSPWNPTSLFSASMAVVVTIVSVSPNPLPPHTGSVLQPARNQRAVRGVNSPSPKQQAIR